MTWIFSSFLVTLCALTSCHIVISKQGDDSTSRQLGPHRCITGRRPRDEKHTVRFRDRIGVERGTRSRAEALGSQTLRLARGCKYWHLLAPGRRYGTRRNPLPEYMSLHLSLN